MHLKIMKVTLSTSELSHSWNHYAPLLWLYNPFVLLLKCWPQLLPPPGILHSSLLSASLSSNLSYNSKWHSAPLNCHLFYGVFRKTFPWQRICVLRLGYGVYTGMRKVQWTLELESPAFSNPGWPLWALVSVQFISVTQSGPTLCDPMNRSMPGLPVLVYLVVKRTSSPSFSGWSWRSSNETCTTHSIWHIKGFNEEP